MTSLTYWKLSLNKFGETYLQKFRTKNVITQKFTFKRSPELVHQLENLFAHLFLQFQLIIIDFHGFIVILVTPPSDQTFGHSILMINHYTVWALFFRIFVFSKKCSDYNVRGSILRRVCDTLFNLKWQCMYNSMLITNHIIVKNHWKKSYNIIFSTIKKYWFLSATPCSL